MTVHDVARRLPDIPALRDRCRSMAMTEAILAPGSPYRRHGFDAHWSPGRELGWMDNGAGDEYSVIFSPEGVYIRGFDHESPMSPYAGDGSVWPGVVDAVPEVFRSCVDEPSFAAGGTPHVTACLWRTTGDDRWRTGQIEYDGGGSDPDGASYLFSLLVDGTFEEYADWARGYYDTPVDLDAVRHVHALRPLTPEVVAALNPDVTLEQLTAEIAAIGYPQSVPDPLHPDSPWS
ncbi:MULTISPECIES: hypothetical protein [unclassified Streptomyces]|uniref:hypothetical protein n=1 Tax=unclassified Streptomyces TaxID=2593676 RepID=UPI003811DC2C